MLVHRKISTLALIWKTHKHDRERLKCMHMSYHRNTVNSARPGWGQWTKLITLSVIGFTARRMNSSNVWGAIRCDLVRDDKGGLVVTLQQHFPHVALETADWKPRGFNVMQTGETGQVSIQFFCYLCFFLSLKLILSLYWVYGIHSKLKKMAD